jgi:ribosomal protein L18
MIRVNRDRKNSRLRRARKTRMRISESNAHRLSVYRSVKHIY